MTRPIRIGNASAFYGDRLTAMRDLVEQADIDVITGDYLAELTILILWKARQKDPQTGYARTFLAQFEQVVTAWDSWPDSAIPTCPAEPIDFGPTSRLPLGAVVAARSGDKGGSANVGVWTDTDERWEWLRSHLTVNRFRELVRETGGLGIHRYKLANLKAVNFVIVGFLGEGVASYTRPDPQAKALGEFLRAVHTDIPDKLAP